jgi:CubicO group peptidase (beta-lactamase class C family)
VIEAAFAPARAAVEAGLIPGATLGVVAADGRRWVMQAGDAAVEPEREPLTRAHWFDLASVTKVIATTTMVLRLAADGRLGLDRPLTDAMPDLRQYDVAHAPERRLTFRDCLAHRTHLPAVEPIYTYGADPTTLRAFVLQREWRAGPPVYSDINYILLGIGVERLTGAPLSAWPLGPGLAYTPEGPAVATERCPWRGRVLKGEVHDENAWALGGAAGHAGLFGTVDGVLDFALGLLDGTGASPAMLAAMRERQNGDRTCGWERRFPGWSGGDACSDATIGHTGFTGTGLWVDFDRRLAWTLLTNRVHPSRHTPAAQSIFALRPATGDAVIAAFASAPVHGEGGREAGGGEVFTGGPEAA